MKQTLSFMLIIALTVLTVLAAIAQEHDRSSDRREDKTIKDIRTVLDAQVGAWNRGDIESFMDGYWRSPQTLFVSGDYVMRGWDNVLKRYKQNYNTREKMGLLSFSELEIKMISLDAAIATGRWKLTRSGNDSPHGRFTLIMRRKPEGWRIVHDHTSSASDSD